MNVIGAEGVDILPETPCVRPGKKSAQSVLKWDILQMYAKPKIKKFPVDHVYCNYTRVDECTEEEDEYVVAGEAQGGKLTVNIGGIPVEMIIDSGASTNVISQALWEQLKIQHINCV